AQERARASLVAPGPGRVATGILLDFSKTRPPSVRIKSVELVTESGNPTRDKDFVASTKLKFEFFIERLPGADPNEVNVQLREVLKQLKGVSNVIAGPAEDNPAAQGLDVTHTVELDILAQEGAE